MKQKRRKRPRPIGVKIDASARPGISRVLRSEGFRFAVKFGLSCLALQTLFCCILPVSFTKVVCEHTARSLGHVLNVLGFPVNVAGDIVSGGGLAFLIVLECTALFAVVLFACFVSIYHADPRKKAVGLAIGIPALYLGNFARLVLVFVISRYDPRLFTVVHVYLGQVFTMLLIMLSIVLWLRWVNGGPAPGQVRKASGFLVRFVLISGGIFVLWLAIHHWYIWFLDRFIILGFYLFGYRLFFPPMAAVYYETFSIVVFTSLVLVTRAVEWPRKARWLAAGMAVFLVLHLFHRVNNAMRTAFHFTSLFPLDVFLCDIGQYLLPVLFWVVLARDALSPPNSSPKSTSHPHLLPWCRSGRNR